MSEGMAASWPFPYILMTLPYKSVHALYTCYLNLLCALLTVIFAYQLECVRYCCCSICMV